MFSLDKEKLYSFSTQFCENETRRMISEDLRELGREIHSS